MQREQLGKRFKKKYTEKYLLAHGWVENKKAEHKSIAWTHTSWDETRKSRGGLDITLAGQDQQQEERWAAGKPWYFYRRNRYGFGYDLVARTQGKKGGYTQQAVGQYTEDIILEAVDSANDSDLDIRPDYPNDNKIVVVSDDGYFQYYPISNMDEFKIVALHVFKKWYEGEYFYLADEEPFDEAGEKPDIELDKVLEIKNETIRRAYIQAWENFKYAKKRYVDDQHYNEYIKLALKGNADAAIYLFSNKFGREEGKRSVTVSEFSNLKDEE